MKFLAIDIGGTAIKYGIADENIEISKAFEIPSNTKLGASHIIKEVFEIIESCKNDIAAVGISTAGQVDSDRGKLLYANDNFPDYTGTEFSKLIKEKFNIPAYIENDVNSAATGEAVFGAGKGCNDFICLTYGTGIGGAIWQNGKLYKGSNYSAAEFGSITTHANGRLCACGNKGCYEMYASTNALVSDVKASTGSLLNGREIFSPEHFNNPEIKNIIDNWIDEIVIGLSSLIFVFNPSLIILGGGIMNQNYIVEKIKDKIKERDIHSFKSVEIKKAQLGNKAGIIGAAYIAKSKYSEEIGTD